MYIYICMYAYKAVASSPKDAYHSVDVEGFVPPQFQGVTWPNLHHIWP